MMISKNTLIQMGFPRHTAENISRQAKIILVNEGFLFYNCNKVGFVPAEVVEKQILGTSIPEKLKNG